MPRGKRNKPEIDICRVRTDRLREMTADQLDRAARRVGLLYEIPKRQQGVTRPRWLLSLFLTELRNGKRPDTLSERSREADRTERLIWDMQAKRGCKLRPEEVVARDAAREGRSADEIDRIRGRRRPKIR